MLGSKPMSSGAVVELDSEDLIDVPEDRASILSAAATAQNIAMLTGQHGVVTPPLLRPRARLPLPDAIESGAFTNDEDAELGRLAAFVEARTGDPVAECRARLELAQAELERGRVAEARAQIEEAVRVSEHASVGHAMLRRLLLGRETVDEQLTHVAALVAHATCERTRADWLCERARLLEAKGGASSESVATWTEALALSPDHVGAMYGVEVALEKMGAHGARADVLDRLAALMKENEAAAWIHVERAILLDRRQGDVAAARAAFARALELAPALGPVRAACVDHAVRHRDDAGLGRLLETEAGLEPDPARAAYLELDAALAYGRAGTDRAHITKVLERAHSRAPTTPLVDIRVVDELARLYDADGRHSDALRARKALLKSIDDSREELVLLRAIATSAHRAGETDDVLLALERARMLEPDDATLLADLDRHLANAQRHDARAILWMREAARVEDPLRKARALLSSADAASAGGRKAEAGKQREAAWLTAPTAPGVYDTLADRLAPVAPTSEVRERVNFYQRAVRATTEPDRKIHLLEKIAWLEDDVLGDVVAAGRVYEEILAIEPGRLSAIIGLASAATRRGDAKGLARALSAQADVTADAGERAELRLRAAESLAEVESERALALAEELWDDLHVGGRAAEIVTRLHAAAERWDLAANALARRASAASDPAMRIALVLAEVDVLIHRLHAPERALAALARLPDTMRDDAAVRAASLEALELLGDEERLRATLTVLADETSSPSARARLLVRAAELDELHGRDPDAVAAYERAREGLPNDAFVTDRLRRIGARAPLGTASIALVSPLGAAIRALEGDEVGSAETLLATGARDIATLRVVERLARRVESAPQLANALAMMADAHPSGFIARRALEGLASLVAWTLPSSGDYEPWERLLALGGTDIASIDELLGRAASRVRGNDDAAIRVSIRALERRVERATEDSEQLLWNLDLARMQLRAGAVAKACAAIRRALTADPTSLSAASLLAEAAAELGDDEAAILASRSLAAIVTDRNVRADLLCDAADLCAASGNGAVAAELFEQALDANPERVGVAARLADLQRTRGAFAELGRVLTKVLAAARTPEAIVPMASELADVAKTHLSDPLLAIASLERLREVSPRHVPALFLLSELFIGQRAWDKALVALAQTVEATSERADKLVALVGRASIYRRVFQQPALAEAELRAALEIDAHDTRAIRGLLELGDAVANDERAALLGRLVVGETAPQQRLVALLELADARRATGDLVGAEGALVEAAALSPDGRMLERVRAAVGKDREALARVLSRAVARAHEGDRAIDPTWLVALGQLELELGRHDEAIERFEEALRADDRRDDARVFLARALSARGRHDPAVEALAPVLLGASRRHPVDASLVRLLESSLSGAGRATEQWVARELRAVAGDLAPREQAELDARIAVIGHAEGLGPSSLRSSVMPGVLGRHPLWDVASLASGLAGKLARISLSQLGAHARDRVKPRTAHPTRALFDRVVRAFGVEGVELAVSAHVSVPSVACEDDVWLVVPAALDSYSEAHAVAALAGPVARIALGVPWLFGLGAHEVLALLTAFARQVEPSFASPSVPRIESLVDEYDQRARRAIDRKRRRALEELAPMLDRAPVIDEAAFVEAVMATEARAAFLLSGSLRASLDAVAPAHAELAAALRVPGPPSLSAVLGHVSSRDLTSFALSGETTALRRSIGSLTW